MVRRGCLIGLNYYGPFLCDGGEVRSLDDVYRVSQADADGIFFENARTFLRKNLG